MDNGNRGLCRGRFMENEKCRFTPVKLSKTQVRQRYAKLSGIYDFWGFLTESKAVKRALQLAKIRNGESILEVAVGTGSAFMHIVSMNERGRNEGVDLSPEMLARAKKRLKNHPRNYSLKVADAYSLPYVDETFDLVFNSYMFDLLPEGDFSRVLQEFKRVLRPGGRIVITSMTQGRSWYSRMWDRLVRRYPNILEGCRPISLEDDAKQAGYENIRIEYISQFSFPSLVLYAEKHASSPV
jgi:ubiquinone/menaquinone biosynthesis C-methylase UbiE